VTTTKKVVRIFQKNKLAKEDFIGNSPRVKTTLNKKAKPVL
jgi:hypothetical protein